MRRGGGKIAEDRCLTEDWRCHIWRLFFRRAPIFREKCLGIALIGGWGWWDWVDGLLGRVNGLPGWMGWRR